MELKMLFCQQKNVKRITAIAGIVMAAHCCAVWFVCLKTVVHHFTIPLSAPLSSVRIKLNKSMPVVKNQAGQSVGKSQNKKSVQALQKTSQPPMKQPVQKASVQKAVNKSNSTQKSSPKKSEPKKPVVQETQKIIPSKEVEIAKEVETVKKSDAVSAINHPVSQIINETKADQEVVIEPAGPINKIDYYDVVYETMIEQWRPPIGIVKGTSCTVSFTIDKKGMPVDIEFEKKSGVLMFDMSIKAVLARVTFSPLFVGNRFSILFTV
jgi:hypothetical protein